MVNLSFRLRSRFYIATIHQEPSPILCRRNPLERLDHPFTATRRHLPLRHLPGRIACLKQESAKLIRRQLSMVGKLPEKLHRDDLIDDRYTNGWFPSIGHLLGETSRFHWDVSHAKSTGPDTSESGLPSKEQTPGIMLFTKSRHGKTEGLKTTTDTKSS